jgi:hypothetical protein
MFLSKSAGIAAIAIGSMLAAAAPATSSAATFTASPPEFVTEGEGPLVWSFASDEPGTAWGAVTWKVSTEPEWHMCGGPAGSVVLEGMPAGQYWVEIADEVVPGLAGPALREPPFTRCSEPHLPALGPLHPVTLAAVTVTAPIVVTPTAGVSVSAVAPSQGSSCAVTSFRRRRALAMVEADRRSLDRATRAEARRTLRVRLARDQARLRRARAHERIAACQPAAVTTVPRPISGR